MYKHCRTKKCTVNTESMRKKETSLTLQTLYFILWEKTRSCKEMNTIFILSKSLIEINENQ